MVLRVYSLVVALKGVKALASVLRLMLTLSSLVLVTIMGLVSFWAGYASEVPNAYLLPMGSLANYYGTRQHISGTGHGQRNNVTTGLDNRY